MARVNIDMLGIRELKWTGMEEKEQDHPQEKEMQKSKMAEEALQNTFEKKRSKKQRSKGKIYPFDAEFQRKARRGKKAFHSDQRKEIE